MTLNMVSCKSTVSFKIPQWSLQWPAIKNALLTNPKLEKVHLVYDVKDLANVDWDIQDTTKLPPLNELIVRSLLD